MFWQSKIGNLETGSSQIEFVKTNDTKISPIQNGTFKGSLLQTDHYKSSTSEGSSIEISSFNSTFFSTEDSPIQNGFSQINIDDSTISKILAESSLSSKAQIQLQELLIKNSENHFSNEETEIVDRLLAQVDQLNILKTRARYTLNIFQNKQQVM